MLVTSEMSSSKLLFVLLMVLSHRCFKREHQHEEDFFFSGLFVESTIQQLQMCVVSEDTIGCFHTDLERNSSLHEFQ
jgi:hypothetical protein